MKNTESAPLADAEPTTQPTHPPLHVQVSPYGMQLAIIATVALVFALDWGQSFFVALLVGILIAYTLNPPVTWLQRIGIPRTAATTVVVVGVVSALVFGVYSLRGQVQTIINQLPIASSKISKGLDNLRQSQQRNMQKMESAARVFESKPKAVTVTPPSAPVPAPKQNVDAEPKEDIEEATPESASIPTPTQQVQIVVQQSSSKLNEYLWAGSLGALGALGQTAMVIFLIFFLLLAGETFKRKLVRISGPSLSQKKITIQILDDINQSIQRYMFMLLVTNVMIGVFTWVALRLIGVENAGAWAVAAGVLHLIPYFGPAVTAGLTGIAAFIQFDSFSTALLVAGVSLAIATFIGMVVTTWMTGRIAKMNTAAVFIALLFWGWLWGVWGLLLAIPIVVIVKVVSQQVEQLHPLAELLGE